MLDQNREFTGWNPYGCIKECQQNFNIFEVAQINICENKQKIKKNHRNMIFLAIFCLNCFVIRIQW
jgi:hypothetical protein